MAARRAGKAMHGHRTGAVVSRLLALGCPYLQGMEEGVVGRVVTSPGEARVRVLSWLVERFHSGLPVGQRSTSVSKDTGSLTGILADMGICAKDNSALVEGHSSMHQQLLFLESLLDMVEIVQAEGSISQQLECSCRFTDAICCSENLDTSVFPRSLNLLPPDISPPGASTGREPLFKSGSVEEMRREAERLTALARDRATQLHTVTQQHHYEEINEAALQSSVKTLAVSLGTLAQLLVHFCQSYEAELQPWVGHRPPAPALGGLGPLCKRTSTQWNHVNKVLHSLRQLEATLVRLTGLQSIPVKPESASLYPACFKAQEALQQCIDLVADLRPT